MAITRKQNRRERLSAYVETRPAGPVGRCEWEHILELLAPISDRTLRGLLRELSVPMEPLLAGVDQSSMETLEVSLLALLEVYRQGPQRDCRRLVIQAKDHARWASRRAKDNLRRIQKQEMVDWMLVWLESPEVFPVWLRVRKQAIGAGSTQL